MTLTIDEMIEVFAPFASSEDDAVLAEAIREAQQRPTPQRHGYLLEIDVDYNHMIQACEIEERRGRYEFYYGVPYTPELRHTQFEQWGIHWYRDERGVLRAKE
jgi:hypothetical protein